VNLQSVVERLAECLEYIDVQPNMVGVNRRTGERYQPGVQALTESVVVPYLDQTWETLHPGERPYHQFEVSYPTISSRSNLDLAFSTEDALQVDGCDATEPEWGIEVKRLQFVGNNGKNGDYETAKVLSPYLKDRGMLHDAIRLREYGWTQRIAIIGYGFNYDEDSLTLGLARHSTERAIETLTNIKNLVERSGPLHLRTLVEFADAILGLRGLSKGARVETGFEAWTHPAGGRGIVFGWEVRRPERELGFDPRHPW
jgi:hypothetical protein